MNFISRGKRVIVVLLGIPALLLVQGCAGETQGNIDELEAEIAVLEAKIAELEKASGFDFEDRYEAQLRKLFTEDELRELAVERGMVYQLRVNQELVTGPEVVVAPGEMLSISVSEGMVMSSDGYNTLLPNRILQLAMLDDLVNHIDVETETEFFTSPAAGTVVWGFGFIFENAGKGTKIKVTISDILRERLGLDDCEIMVMVE